MENMHECPPKSYTRLYSTRLVLFRNKCQIEKLDPLDKKLTSKLQKNQKIDIFN
jgi:hypothetical protein